MTDKWKGIVAVVLLLGLLFMGKWQGNRILLPVCAAEIAVQEESEKIEIETESETETEIETEIDTETETEIETETEMETETETESELPLMVTCLLEGDLPGQSGYYRGNVMVSPQIEGGGRPLQTVLWTISCCKAENGEKDELSGTLEELTASLDEWGIEIKKESEEEQESEEESEVGMPEKSENMESLELIFSMEGGYTVQISVIDKNGSQIESEIVSFVIDKTAPSVSLKKKSTAAWGHGIYGSSEVPELAVEVQEKDDEAGISGISEITYYLTDAKGNESEGNLLSENTENPLVKWQGSFSLRAEDFPDGQLVVYVSVSDRAGNSCKSELVLLQIDTHQPEVTIHFDTSDLNNGKYSSHRKILEIIVQDENFDLEYYPVVRTDNQNGYAISEWKINGKQAKCGIVFLGDGEYTVDFVCRDLAGNQSEEKIVPAFIIDQTTPSVSVTFDHQPVYNEKYYQEKRTAVICVEERNFWEEDTEIVILSGKGGEKELKSSWVADDNIYRTEVVFEEDDTYSLAVTCSDPAGNTADKYESGQFVIDRTKPELRIDGIDNGSANNGVVAPGIHLYDENDSGKGIDITLKRAMAEKVDIRSMIHTMSYEHGETITFDDFKEDMDGLYTLTASAEDLAGNQTRCEVHFSVNRNGSSYVFSEQTRQVLNQVFIRKPVGIVIFEDNIDWLTYRELSCSCNGELLDWREEENYTVQLSGSDNELKRYTYKIPEKSFVKEGIYAIHLYSEDHAGNVSMNDTARKKVEFILDRTAPVIMMTGLEERGYYHEKEHEFTAVVSDTLLLDSVRYYLNDELVKEYEREELKQAEGVLHLKTGSSADYQKIKLEASDAAGNLAESDEWHVLVNQTRQTKIKPFDRTERLPEIPQERQSDAQTEEVKEEGGIAVIFVLVLGAAVIGSFLIIWYDRKKIKNNVD